MVSGPIRLEPELIPFAAHDEREWIQSETVSSADKERLLVELRRRLAVWRTNLKPTREQLLQVTHEENRIHARLDGGNAQFWEALDADWRRKQQPVHWEPSDEWSSKARDWLETQRRTGRVFNSEKDAGEAYVASQRHPFPVPSEAQVSRDRILQMRMVGLRPDPEDVEKVLRDNLEYQQKLAEKVKKVEAGFGPSQSETLTNEPTQTETSKPTIPPAKPGERERSHVDWLWNGMAVVVVLFAAVFWGALFVLAEAFFAMGIWKAPWFDKQSPRKRWLYKGSLIAGIGIFLFVFWWFIPPPDIVGALQKAFGSKASSQPTPEVATSPRPSLSAPSPSAMPSPRKGAPTVNRNSTPRLSPLDSGTAILRMADATTVRSRAVTATSNIQVSSLDGNVSGPFRIVNIKPGVSFQIESFNGADYGKVAWVMYSTNPH